MKRLMFIVLSLLAFSSVVQAQTAINWEPVSDPEELRVLFSGNTYGGLDWIWHFRSDGKLGSFQYDTISIREWTITEVGEICFAVFTMPDKIIRCETVQKSDTSPLRLRMVSDIGKFEMAPKEAPKELIDALVERAGSE